MLKFDIIAAINNVVPGAKFRGTVIDHTELEYNNLEQHDPRDKPTWSVIFNEALSELRRDVKLAINRKTDNIIEYDMVYNDGTNTVPIHLGVEEQINLDTMDRLRDELHAMGEIVYPYELKVSDNEDGEGNYISLNSKDHFHHFFLMGVAHKNRAIAEGRNIKDTLGTMTRTQLEEFIDPRE